LSLRAGGSGGWRRPLAAGLLLLAVYVGLSFLNSPRGFLGTDTGGKVATLRVMAESGRFDPDLGYWAEEWDPDGALHPIALTSHLGDRWVNVTTLPALWVGWLLYDLGGYRATLLVPMAGSIAAALAARRLLERLGCSERWAWGGCFVVGLASPLTVYALDFWEHSLGVALLGWSAVFVLDAVGRSGRPWVPGLVAGGLAGAATTMRTEGFVYAAVLGGVVLGVPLVRRRRIGDGTGAALAFGTAVATCFAAGAAVERAVLESSIRPARATGTALTATAAGAGTRLEEAVITTVAFGGRAGMALGAVTVVLLVVGGAAVVRRRLPLVADGALALAAGAYGVVAVGGLGFVPGVATASPLAAHVGPPAVRGDRGAREVRSLLLVLALVPVPLVLAFQYVGGAGPQWGGRYLLPTSLLLLVVGWAGLERAERLVQAVFLGLAVLVTAYGLVWLSVRSHQVAGAIDELERRPEGVLLSRVGHLAREGGATYGDRRWLTTNPGATTGDVRAVLDGAGIDTVATVELPQQRPLVLPGFEAVDRHDQPLFHDLDLRVTSWRRTG
jgi:hypothetical protein